MAQRKTWSSTEDQMLKELMMKNQLSDSNKYKWGQIAEFINRNGSHRTGKQCRQRWHNQLKPGIDNQRQWTKQQQQILFSTQQSIGNKWAQIAKQLPGRTDNNIKNYFYSTLRKALRKVNSYISFHKKEQIYKNVKQLKQQTLNKVLSVAEQKYEHKISLKRYTALQDAQEIKRLLIEIQRNDNIIASVEYNEKLVETIDKILEFNRNCKRRKGKKKDEDQDYLQSQELLKQQHVQQLQSEEQQQNEKIKQQKFDISHDQDKRKKNKKNQKQQNLHKKISSLNQSNLPQNQKKQSSLLSSNQFIKQSIAFVSNSSSSKEKNSIMGMSHSFQKYCPNQFEGSHQYFNNFSVGTNDPSDFLSRLPIIQKRQTIRNGDDVDANQFWRDDNSMPPLNNLNPFEASQNYIALNDNPLIVSLNTSGFLQKKGSSRVERRESEFNN